ncbi:MAG: hypothetical protein AAB724_00665, partial [Patescibacteria group bacterium]
LGTNKTWTYTIIDNDNPPIPINLFKFNMLMVNWGKVNANNAADFNVDSKVDMLDFNWLMNNWLSLLL